QGVVALSLMAWNLWLLGQPGAAIGRAREAVVLARRLNHPFSVAFALFYETALHWLRRDVDTHPERAAEVSALSETRGLPLWVGLGRVWHGAALVTQGDPGALSEIVEALALAAETGNQTGAPAIFAILAETQQTARRLGEAQASVATGLAMSAQTGQ